MPLGVDTTLVNSFDSIGLGFFFLSISFLPSLSLILSWCISYKPTHDGNNTCKSVAFSILCVHLMFPLHAPHFILYSLSNTPQQLSSKFTRCGCVCVHCALCIDIYLFWVFHFVILCCLLWFGALVRFDFGMCVSCCLIPWCKLRSSTLFAYYTFYSFPFYHTVSLAFFALAFSIMRNHYHASVCLTFSKRHRCCSLPSEYMFHLSKVLRKSILWIFSSVFTFWLLSYLLMGYKFLIFRSCALCCIIVVIYMYWVRLGYLSTRHSGYLVLISTVLVFFSNTF